MAPYAYNNNNNYYDPVGSQTNHPQSYTYQSATSPGSAYPISASSNTYGSSTYQNYGNGGYESQQRSSGTERTASGAGRAAATLSTRGGQDFAQGSSNRHMPVTSRYENTSNWSDPNYTSNTYSSNAGLTQASRSHASASPVYGGSNSSQSVPQAANGAQLLNTSRNQNPGYEASSTLNSNYMHPSTGTQNHVAAQPQRYSSPLHAQQAQQHGRNQASSSVSGRRTSPQILHQDVHQRNRQQNSSAERIDTTVNPAAVYDNRAELQRKAQLEAEKRRKQQEVEAARKAEEERVKAAQKAQEDRLMQEKEKEDEAARKFAEEVQKKKADNARKAEQRKKKREEKMQSKNAASALQQLATSAYGGSGDGAAPAANDEETEMRAMFKRMREFNQRNPTMLAKLWEEERKAHATAQSQTKQSVDSAQPTNATQAAQTQQPIPAPRASAERTQPQDQSPLVPFTRPQDASTTQKVAQRKQQQAIWPPGQKGKLAEAAARWLNGQASNWGKTVKENDILKLLDDNPPYVTLCESLEAMGLKFERAAFAKELLRAAPDSMKTQSSLKPITSSVSSNGVAPQARASTQGVKDNEVAKEKPGTVDYETHPFSGMSHSANDVNRLPGQPSWPTNSGLRGPVPGPGGHYHSPYFSQPPQQSAHISLQQYEPKQTELVLHGDAAGVSSHSATKEMKPESQPSPPSLRPPADKEEAARKRKFGDLVDLTGEDSDEGAPPHKADTAIMPSLSNLNGIPQPALGSQFSARFSYQQGPTGVQGPGHVALHPSAPAAFTRMPSMMQATSIVPHQVSSQAPAALMQPPAPPKPKGPSQEQLQQQRIKGKMLVEPIMRDRVARKSTYDSRTIARDVLIATGRHPDMRPLNGHLYSMQRLLGERGGQIDVGDTKGNRSDLSTIRWDIIDPVPVTTESKGSESKGRTDTTDAALEALMDPPKQKVTVVSASQEHGHDKANARYTGKKRGRPSKEEQKRRQQLAGGAARTNPESASDSRSVDPSVRPATPNSTSQNKERSTPMSSESAVGYAAFRQTDEHGNIVKRKGRPPGWRKHIHSREAHGLAPAKAGASSTPSSSKKASALVEPVYQVFECAWQNCNAKLHNLDALKKHLVKNHGKANDFGTFDCLWSDCGEPASQDLVHWMAHVNREHLQPVAWKLGDGPKAGLAVSRQNNINSSSYLFDASGRSVTPLISPSLGDEASGRDPVLHIGQLSVGDPAHELESLRKHKRIVGPSMERNGCTLANNKRRLGFLDDEDFEDEIEESDGAVSEL